jgi:hypothetical protein
VDPDPVVAENLSRIRIRIQLNSFRIRITSVADPDPGSGAFLTPGSGRGFFRISDPGSQTHIFEGLVTSFWVKTSIILGKLGQIFVLQHIKNKIIFSFVKFVATKNGLRKKILFTPVFYCCFWIPDPRSGIRDGKKIRIRDKHPGSATLRITLARRVQR